MEKAVASYYLFRIAITAAEVVHMSTVIPAVTGNHR